MSLAAQNSLNASQCLKAAFVANHVALRETTLLCGKQSLINSMHMSHQEKPYEVVLLHQKTCFILSPSILKKISMPLIENSLCSLSKPPVSILALPNTEALAFPQLPNRKKFRHVTQCAQGRRIFKMHFISFRWYHLVYVKGTLKAGCKLPLKYCISGVS